MQTKYVVVLTILDGMNRIRTELIGIYTLITEAADVITFGSQSYPMPDKRATAQVSSILLDWLEKCGKASSAFTDEATKRVYRYDVWKAQINDTPATVGRL